MISIVNAHVWLVLFSALVPLVTYFVNHVGPQVTEPVKAAVLVVASAIVGGLYEAVDSGGFGFNNRTLQYVLVAVVSAFVSHGILWQPSGVSDRLGGGSNAVPTPPGGVTSVTKQGPTR